jgi:hypothetical protein
LIPILKNKKAELSRVLTYINQFSNVKGAGGIQFKDLADNDKNTPLHMSLEWPVEVMQLLLQWGANRNIKNKNDMIPFHEAVVKGKLEHLHLLCNVMSSEEIFQEIAFVLLTRYCVAFSNRLQWKCVNDDDQWEKVISSVDFLIQERKLFPYRWTLLAQERNLHQKITEKILLCGIITDEKALERIFQLDFPWEFLDEFLLKFPWDKFPFAWNHSAMIQACRKATIKQQLSKSLHRVKSSGCDFEFDYSLETRIVDFDLTDYFEWGLKHSGSQFWNCKSPTAVAILSKMIYSKTQKKPYFLLVDLDEIQPFWRFGAIWLSFSPAFQTEALQVEANAKKWNSVSMRSRKEIQKAIFGNEKVPSKFLILLSSCSLPMTPTMCQIVQFHLQFIIFK